MMGPGIIGRDLDIIKDLGIVSQLRGMDGAGVFQIRSSTSKHVTWDYAKVMKTGLSFSELTFDMKKSTGMMMNSTMVDVVIGHVRAATRGFVNSANAHPFTFDNLVGAHNGTLRDAKYDDKTSAGRTDSELMFADINERGLEPVLKDLDKDSAYALVMYDKVKKEVIFTRNHLRTLSIAFNEARSVAYWASEKDMLEYVLDRSGEEYKTLNFLPHFIVRVKPSDISCVKTRENPMKNLTNTKKLTLELPTAIQTRMDKLEADRLKKEKEKQVETPTTFQGGHWTNSQTSITQQGSQIIIPNDPKVGITVKQPSRQFGGSCVCGKTKMNIVTMDRARRGIHDTIRYNGETEHYHCIDCPPIVKTAKSA